MLWNIARLAWPCEFLLFLFYICTMQTHSAVSAVCFSKWLFVSCHFYFSFEKKPMEKKRRITKQNKNPGNGAQEHNRGKIVATIIAQSSPEFISIFSCCTSVVPSRRSPRISFFAALRASRKFATSLWLICRFSWRLTTVGLWDCAWKGGCGCESLEMLCFSTMLVKFEWKFEWASSVDGINKIASLSIPFIQVSRIASCSWSENTYFRRSPSKLAIEGCKVACCRVGVGEGALLGSSKEDWRIKHHMSSRDCSTPTLNAHFLKSSKVVSVLISNMIWELWKSN